MGKRFFLLCFAMVLLASYAAAPPPLLILGATTTPTSDWGNVLVGSTTSATCNNSNNIPATGSQTVVYTFEYKETDGIWKTVPTDNDANTIYLVGVDSNSNPLTVKVDGFGTPPIYLPTQAPLSVMAANGGSGSVRCKVVSSGSNCSDGCYSTTYTYATYTVPDVNVWQARVGDLNYSFIDGVLPIVSSSRDGNISIDFNVFTADNRRLTADINYSTGKTQGAGTVIAKDLNLGAAVCSDQDWADVPSSCHWDWQISGASDGNYFILIKISSTLGITDFNAGNVSLGVDNNGPTTTDNDFNNSWQNIDANILFSCADTGIGCKHFFYSLDDVNFQLGWGADLNIGIVLTTDGNHEIFYWSGDKADNNAAAKLIYLAIDQNAPRATFGETSLEVKSKFHNLTITCDDNTSGAAEYFFKDGEADWFSNGSSPSYLFSTAEEGKITGKSIQGGCIDNAGNTSDINGSISLSFNVPSSGPVPAPPPQPPPPPPVKTEKKQVLAIENSFVPPEKPSIVVLDITEKDAGLKAKRFATAEEVRFTRALKVAGLFQGAKVIRYQNTVLLTVKNIGTETLSGVALVESIPKDFAESASFISSDSNFVVIEDDPVVKFLVGDLAPGEKASVSYDFNRAPEKGLIGEDAFKSMDAPFAMVLLEEDGACTGVYCNDFNPCTSDYCERGECVFAASSEGEECGQGMVCEGGECMHVREPEKPPIGGKPEFRPETSILPVALAAAAALVAVCLGALVFAGFRKKRRH